MKLFFHKCCKKSFVLRSGLLFLLSVSILSACKHGDEVDVPGNSQMEQEINQILGTKGRLFNVKKFGAKGDGKTDDTSAFQMAVDSAFAMGGGTVFAPKGIYLIDAKKSINMKSDVNLYLGKDSSTVLAAIPNDTTFYFIIKAENVENIKIYGGKIKGERFAHKGTTGEWGMGIGLYSTSSVSIENMLIRDCWGDGIYFGKSKTTKRMPANTTISNVTCTNNRRQGMSIVSANGAIITNSTFSFTEGTAPAAGVDIEPNDYDTVQNVTFRNCKFKNNRQIGFLIYCNLKNGVPNPPTRMVKNIQVINNDIFANQNFAVRITGDEAVPALSNIIIKNNRIWGNTRPDSIDPNVVRKDNICENCELAPNTVLTQAP